jgi:hypothetical protein
MEEKIPTQLSQVLNHKSPQNAVQWIMVPSFKAGDMGLLLSEGYGAQI